ncbi:hypothetical protein Slin15195_G125030 [Septoria linicola]|uniref:DUF6604 domain-containing protein n=1 Tax=Septoria linicola TaxID=215465 RepID=A0A9Q9B1F2_9PEZI|nr:hypothetical protein Slin14017_G081220 [Septoria linicola]USW59184.1 hypothetical protein Slin15195_G125030 [Septoria linicola]
MKTAQSTPVLGRHELYKSAQHRVVEWLVRAACKTSVQPKSATVVNSRQLLSLAQALRDSDISVPSTILSLLSDVIDGRQSCADWFSLQSEADVVDNERYQWFVGILRQVHTILLPLVSGDSGKVNSTASYDKDRASSTIAESVKISLANYFAELEMKQPSDTPLGQRATKITTNAAPRADLAVQLEDDDLDITFAIWCQLEDQREVRQFVNKIWLDVAANSISLTTASVITETAIGLMRVNHRDFIMKYHDFKDYWHLLEHFSLEAFNNEKLTYVRPKKATTVPGKAPSQELVKQLCPAAAFLLQDLRDEMKIFAESETGVYLYRQGRTSVQLYDRMEFVMGIAEFHETGFLPPWLVVACAIYMDMYEVVGGSPGCAAKAWIAENKRMKARLLEVSAHHRTRADTPFQCWYEELQPMFHRRRTVEPHFFVTDKILRDSFGPTPSRSQREWLGSITFSIQASPCAAGSQIWDDRMAYHKVGIRVANHHLMVLALATLYNATKRLGLLSST